MWHGFSDEARRAFAHRRCESASRSNRCENPHGHDGYHWNVGTNLVHVWGLDLGGDAMRLVPERGDDGA